MVAYKGHRLKITTTFTKLSTTSPNVTTTSPIHNNFHKTHNELPKTHNNFPKCHNNFHKTRNKLPKTHNNFPEYHNTTTSKRHHNNFVLLSMASQVHLVVNQSMFLLPRRLAEQRRGQDFTKGVRAGPDYPVCTRCTCMGPPATGGPQIGLSTLVKCRDPRIFQYYLIGSCLHE
jgi:hypothetical protein